MLSIGISVPNSPACNWEAVFVVSKAILVQARPPGSVPGMYSLRRTSRRIVHASCPESIKGQIEDRLSPELKVQPLPSYLIRMCFHR